MNTAPQSWRDDVETLREALYRWEPRYTQFDRSDAIECAYRLAARLERADRMEDALRDIQTFQRTRVETYRERGIVFDQAPNCDPTSWQGVAFWTYTDLCGIEWIARAALADEEPEGE